MIVCIGDSITAGQHLPPRQAWPRLLSGDVVAAGVSGDTTRLGLERFPRDVQVKKPEAVVIQFGHNDCNRWDTDRSLPRVSPAAYRANLIEMVERSRWFGAHPFLCTLIPTEKNPTAFLDVKWYDSLLRGVALETKATVIDVRAAWGFDMLLDGVHPTREGHQLYAKTVQAVLDDVLG